ncbi:MrfF [Citrobacter sp. NCU1]|uniref:fimbrial protein n=1 Tax=Citrobacter sp. NCU1 TaxID=2026683 RepID=UPI00139178E3|nr:fimbrial protein [Citrobacter sp. NCU1]NDO83184.1 MrfF [Citrobacter sp. NCU1]
MTKQLFIVSMILCLLLNVVPVTRADTGNQYKLNISVTGTVVANGSCTFNQGGTLNVNFGTVQLKDTGNGTIQLDGDYLKPLTSDFYCTGDTKGLLQMRFTSASGSYETYNGSQVLATDKGIIAIELLKDSVPSSMGEWFNVDSNSQPKLEAQIVQVSNNNTSNVTSGTTFSASGTLTMAFN